MALILINFTNPWLVHAHLSQEEANPLDIPQPLPLSGESEGKAGDQLVLQIKTIHYNYKGSMF